MYLKHVSIVGLMMSLWVEICRHIYNWQQISCVLTELTLRIDNTHISPKIITWLHFTSLHFPSLHFTSVYITALHCTLLPIFHFPALLDVSSPRFKNPSLLLSYIHCHSPLSKKYVIYIGKSLVLLQAVGSTVWLSYLQRSIYRYLFLFPGLWQRF